jgi:T5SS/PEP-CTERM-associated repeat protein
MFAKKAFRVCPLALATCMLANSAASNAFATGLSWNNAAGGTASIAGNWSPAQIPGSADDLVFNLNSTYAVTFNATTAASHTQTFRDGTVTLTMSAAHTSSAGVTVGDLNGDVATAIFTTGTWNSGGPITIGDAAGSNGTLTVNDDDADLLMTGTTSDMIVGSNAPGTLNITGGGLVQVADQLIAGNNAAGTSHVTVSGATSVLPLVRSTLNVLGTGTSSKLGQGGDATVAISNGARANFAGDVVVSNGSASTSTVTVAGLGGIVPQNATLDVAGGLLLGRNTNAGAAAGVATLNANADGRVLVGGTLFVAGDPDGGTATLHTATDSLITVRALDVGNGSTLDLDGGAIDIDGGAFDWHVTSASATFNGGVGNPTITMRNGATASLSPVVGARALTVGAGTGANNMNFDVRSGSDLNVPTGLVVLGDGTDDFGGMIINGAGSTMTLNAAGGDLIVGLNGAGRFEAEAGATVSANSLVVASGSNAVGNVLFESSGTTATFRNVFIGGASGGPGGSGGISVNAQAVLTVTSPGSIFVFPDGKIDVSPDGTINAPSVNPLVEGILEIENAGTVNASLTQITDGAVLRGPSDVPGTGTLNGRVRMLSGGTLLLTNGDLVVGDATSPDGFEAQDGSLVSIGGHRLTLNDQNRAKVDTVTIAGGEIVAPNGLEIVTPGTNGTLDGFGTITTSELFIESGGSVITATGASGITINGKFRNNSGLIDGTKYTFNNNPAISDSGWTGAGTISAQVVFNSGTQVNALANMTMGDGSNFGVTFNAGSELHADTRTVTLLDGNGVGLPTVTDVNGGHVVCAQPLTVNSGRRLSGRGGSVDCPTLTINGRLAPGELVGVPIGETGELTINGNLVYGSVNANTDIEIQGLLGPAEYDRVVVNGAATLDGDLNISFINGFNPPLGSVWTIMEYNSKVGNFQNINVLGPSCVFVAVSDNAIVVSRGLPGDLDHDGDVDIADLAFLLSNFGCHGGVEFPCPVDLDFNGDTDITDLAILLSNFGQTCS